MVAGMVIDSPACAVATCIVLGTHKTPLSKALVDDNQIAQVGVVLQNSLKSLLHSPQVGGINAGKCSVIVMVQMPHRLGPCETKADSDRITHPCSQGDGNCCLFKFGLTLPKVCSSGWEQKPLSVKSEFFCPCQR